MNKPHRKTISAFVCLLFFGINTVQFATAAEEKWDFTYFTSGDSKLSFNNINAISQDSHGFIWIATEDGLNRYDGNTFVCFYKEALGVNTDFITALCPDGQGNMWIGTDKGATFYCYQEERFIPLTNVSDKGTFINGKVTHIAIDRNGKVWMSVNGLGLFSYHPKTQECINYFSSNGATTLPVNIKTFFIDNNDEFWFALYFSDLWHSDSQLRSIEPVKLQGWKMQDDIVAIERNPSNNTLYIVGWRNGLCEVDIRTGRFTTLIPNRNNSMPMRLFLSKEKKLWLATTVGLYLFDTIEGTTTFITADKNNKFSLADENVTSVFIDNNNGLWVGTLASGLNYCAGFHKNFEKYYAVGNEPLAGSFITDMAKDANGRLWIASDKKGLLYLDIKKNELHYYKSPSLPKNIFSIYCDSENIWLGTWSGIYRLNPQTGRVAEYSRMMENYGMIDNKLYKIFKTSSGDILVGSSLGIMRYDIGKDAFVVIEDFNGVCVTDIIETIDRELWVSTYANGIYRYSLNEKKMTRHYGYNEKEHLHLPVDKIMSIYQDDKQEIWAGTYGVGVMRYDPKEDRFVIFQAITPDLARIAFAMMEDDDGRMWIATSNGLVSLNYPEREVNYYTTKDGLLDDMIDGHSSVKTSDGNIYFSSHNGFIRFNPRRFQSDNRIPPLVITDFMIDGQVVKPQQANSPLIKNINETTEITLPHHQNSFGFSLSLLGLDSPASNQCWYKLEGYDSTWKKLETASFHFANIPAGNYMLYVKGVNSNGLWNETHAPIAIIVKEVFYKTTLAYLVYVLLLIGVILIIIRYSYVSAIKQERRKQDEAKRIMEKEMLSEKMTFFTNIIHEIKTPLTLIRTPLQNIMATGVCDKETMEDLTVISNSTDYLDKLVKELLGFVRIAEKGWVLEYKQVNLIEKIEFVYFNFRETVKDKNLNYTFLHAKEKIMINVDESGLIKILNNLLHNAVKYAETYITLSVTEEDGLVAVSFKNDGPAIPVDRRNKIFEPFVQYSDEIAVYSQSFGIGLSVSKNLAELHGGTLALADNETCTEFVLRLPVGEKPAQEDEDREKLCENPSESTSDNTGKPLILVVEDNTDLTQYLVRKLSNDYRAVVTSSAEQALKILEQKEVHIVLSDIALTGMSGIELCRKITTDINLSHTPVVILSALSSTQTKITCIESGASLYIEKPFNLEYLLGSLKVIGQKRDILKQKYLSGETITTPQEFVLTNSDENFLAMLDKIILKNLSDTEFGNDQLAEALSLSKSTLVRKLKGLLDTTPNEYIRTKRLNIAASMLRQSNCRINEVCYAVGFNTPSYFTKMFKRKFGMQPNEYMREYTGKE
jgi:ligand-binding sensor domain-containing protein/signal transduction histidine kinase/DNA-binding response OmpR family regulator